MDGRWLRQYRMDHAEFQLPWVRGCSEPLASIVYTGQLQINRTLVGQLVGLDPQSMAFESYCDRDREDPRGPIFVRATLYAADLLVVRLSSDDEWLRHPGVVRLAPQRSFSWFSCSIARLCSQHGISLATLRGPATHYEGRGGATHAAYPATDWDYFARRCCVGAVVLRLPPELHAQRFEPDPSLSDACEPWITCECGHHFDRHVQPGFDHPCTACPCTHFVDVE